MGNTFSSSNTISDRDLAGKVVVITGCDTGFGNSLSLLLVSKGMKVYSGCLNENGCKGLQQQIKEAPHLYRKGSLTPLVLDVTKDDSVAQFCEKVIKENPQGIFALVNNAGIADMGPMEIQSFEMIKAINDVNYLGPVRMMRGLLPSLRDFVRSNSNHVIKPRIINVASVAGRVICPGISAYSASKHAIKAMTEAVRIEVAPFGILVNLIEPYFAKTPIVTGSANSLRLEKSFKSASSEVQESYGNILDAAKQSQSTLLDSYFTMTPDYVVGFMVKSVTLESPP
jgi:NAD(P)-dependent dehydrogenase (short-subunit alcohol dehydrogenase family)